MSILRNKRKLATLCALSSLLFSSTVQAEESFWEIKGCRIVGSSADITLSTDAILSHNKIHFRLTSNVALKDAPELQLNTARFTGFDLEGSSKGFGFEVEYSPVQVSYFLKPEAMLVAEYEPIYTDSDGKFYSYHAVFPMHELPELISEVSNNCNTFRVSGY